MLGAKQGGESALGFNSWLRQDLGSPLALPRAHPLTCSLGNSPALLTCGVLNPSKFPASFPLIIKHIVGAR